MNRKRLRVALPAAVTLLLFTELVLAHHGNAGFDMSRTITVTGTISKSRNRQPARCCLH